MALLEKRHRQPDQVQKDIGARLNIPGNRCRQKNPAAQQGGGGVGNRQQRHRRHQDDQQIGVMRHQHVIDQPLTDERVEHAKSLKHQREQQHLGKGAHQPALAGNERTQIDRRLLGLFDEIRLRRELQRHPGEVFVYLGKRIMAAAKSRVVDPDAALIHPHQHDKVAQLPVQDAGRLEAVQFIHFKTHGPAMHAHVGGNLEQTRERRALHRNFVAAAQGQQVSFVTERSGTHGQRRQAALGVLRLQDHRWFTPVPDGKKVLAHEGP